MGVFEAIRYLYSFHLPFSEFLFDFILFLQFNNAVCYPYVHEAFGGKSERTSKFGAQAGSDWIPSKNQGKAG